MESAGDAQRPAICQRIRDTRKRLQEQWQEEHPGERENPYSQEAVARRVPVSLGMYGKWERDTEPTLPRLRQIAKALELDEDYFSPTSTLASATARVEAEADRLASLCDQLQQLLARLRVPAEDPADDRSPSEPD